MKVEDVQNLLIGVSRLLTAINDFPVFEEVIEDGSYYTMSDLTMGDAIQALNEIVQGMENVNAPDEFSDLYLTQDLEGAIVSLSELGAAIICADRRSRPCAAHMIVLNETHDQIDTTKDEF